MRTVLNNKGALIIEVLVATMIIFIIFAGGISIVTHIIELDKKVDVIVSDTEITTHMVTIITQDANDLQKNFVSTETLPNYVLLDPASLPIGYDQDASGNIIITDNASCIGDCLKKIGYTVRPLLNQMGMFDVTLTIYDPGTNKTADYNFIVGTN